MPPPLPDGFEFSDAFWLEYDTRMVQGLLIVLRIILAQTIVFFIAGVVACWTVGRRQSARRGASHLPRSSAVSRKPLPACSKTLEPNAVMGTFMSVKSIHVPIGESRSDLSSSERLAANIVERA